MEADDRAWVLRQGTELVERGPLTGGITSLMLALELDGEPRVLRRIDKQRWLRFADELLTREAEVMRLLEATDVPAPRLVAVEPPRLLMTRLPGGLDMGSHDFDALARTLRTIHR